MDALMEGRVSLFQGYAAKSEVIRSSLNSSHLTCSTSLRCGPTCGIPWSDEATSHSMLPWRHSLSASSSWLSGLSGFASSDLADRFAQASFLGHSGIGKVCVRARYSQCVASGIHAWHEPISTCRHVCLSATRLAPLAGSMSFKGGGSRSARLLAVPAQAAAAEAALVAPVAISDSMVSLGCCRAFCLPRPGRTRS